MKKILLSAASLLLLLGSCSQNELEDNILSNDKKVVSATIEGQTNSRLSVTHDETTDIFSLAWSTGDAFKVFGENNEVAVYNWNSGDEFILQSGDVPSTPLYAIYPNSETNAPSIDNGVVTMTLNATPSIENINLPMWAGAPTGTNYTFKHLAAAVQFTLNDIPTGYNSLIVDASKPISGTFTATLTDDVPALASSSTDETAKKVTVSFAKNETQKQNKVFYIPLPAETYESLKISVSNGTDTKELKSWTNLTVVRGKMYYTTAVVDASSVEAVNSILANAGEAATNVNLTTTIDASAGDIEIPSEAKDVSFNFTAAPTTSEAAPLVFNQNEETQSGEATTKLNIEMPAEATGLYAEINTPTATTTMSGGTYTKVTATTATNTLIVGEGTTIQTLEIKGGNVRIEGGAVATITNTNNSNITWVVKTKEELYAAAAVATEIVLDDNITIDADKPVNPIDGQTYDLNKYKIDVTTGSKDVFRIEQADATVTIKNGTIDNQTGNNYALSIRANNVTLNMDSVTIPANDYDGSLHKNGNSTGCTVNLTDCTFNGLVYLSNTNDKSANTLNVSGGSFTSTTQNCFELLNTGLTISGATLNNNVTEQSYQKNGNEGNNFSKPLGYCIAFTNTDGVAAIGSATLSNNIYSIADEDGDYIFNQMDGATLDMEVSRFNEFAIVAAAGGEIKLLADITDAVGLSINKKLVVDFNSKTYTMDKPGTGSTGTQTLGFQLLQGNDIIFKNGTIQCSATNKDLAWESNAAEKGIAMMIQNYANLTLEDMTIDGTNIAHNGTNMRYIVSNNSGTVNLTGSTSITALDGDVAFDVCKYASYTVPEVTVNTTGTITGLVEVSGGTLNVTAGIFTNSKGHCVKVVNGAANFDGGTFTAQEVSVFNMAGTVKIKGGTFTSNDNAVISGNGTDDDKYKNGTIEIIGGTFNANIQTQGYVACGIYHPQAGTLKVTGGTFNINKGCGILMRGGSLDMNNSTASFTFTGDATENTTGKVGDSRVVVPCGKKIVKDAYSGYYGHENISIKGVDESDIYEVVENQN